MNTNTDRPQDQDVITGHAISELEAVGAGYGPLYEEIAQNLGSLSVSTNEITRAHEKVIANKANLKLLHNLRDMLPQAYDREFSLEGKKTQYNARQLQANLLWADWDNSIMDGGFYTYPPYYVLGRSQDVDDPSSEKLLLLQAVDRRWPDEVDPRPIIVRVDKDDLKIRDDLISGIEDREFDSKDIESMISPESGKFILSHSSEGSIRITDSRRGDSTVESVQEKGVRMKYGRFSQKGEWVENGISLELFEEFDTARYMAILAYAFKVEDKIRMLWVADKTESEADTIEEKPNSTPEDLAAQNLELRGALLGMLISSGLADEVKAKELMEERYPTLEI